MERLGKSMTSVGKKLTVGLTLPIVALGAAAIKTSIDLELAFTGVTKTVDGTEQQMASLRKELERLATSGESPVAALAGGQKALFEIAEAAGQLGVGIDDIAEFTDVMGQLALSTNIIGEEGARQLARFANVAGTSLSDLRPLGDVIVDLGNNLATTESEILTFGQRMGTLAQIDFKPENLLAIGGALSSLGIRAEAGASSFVKGAQGLRVMAEAGGTNLQKMADAADLTSDAFLELIRTEPSKAIQAFVGGLGELDISDQVKLLEDLEIKGVRMRATFLALAGGTEILANSLDLASTAIQGNGALLSEAQKFAATTAGQMQILRNNVTQLASDLGDVLLPVFNVIVQKLISLTQWFTNLSDGQKKMIVIIAGIVAVIGPLISTISLLITGYGFLTTAIGFTTGAFTFFTTATTFGASALSAFTFAMSNFGIAAAIATAPIWLIVAAVAALAAGIGLLVLAYKKNFLGFKTFADGFINTWKTMLSRAKTAASQLIQIFFKVGFAIADGLWEGIKSGLKKLLLGFIKFNVDLINKVRDIWKISSPSAVMADIGQDMAGGLQQGLIPGLQQVGNEASQTMNSIASALSQQSATQVGQLLQLNKAQFEAARFKVGAQFKAMGGMASAGGRRTQVQQQIASSNAAQLARQGTQFARQASASRNTQVRSFRQGLTGAGASRTGAANRGGGDVNIEMMVLPPGTPEEMANEVSRIIARNVRRRGGTGIQ